MKVMLMLIFDIFPLVLHKFGKVLKIKYKIISFDLKKMGRHSRWVFIFNFLQSLLKRKRKKFDLKSNCLKQVNSAVQMRSVYALRTGKGNLLTGFLNFFKINLICGCCLSVKSLEKWTMNFFLISLKKI